MDASGAAAEAEATPPAPPVTPSDAADTGQAEPADDGGARARAVATRMLGRLWPRLALEACFLIVVAIVAGLLDLSVVAIFAVIAVAYAATVLLEWTTSRVRSASKPAADRRLRRPRSRRPASSP